jgi:sigma-E factor negative regulatory protein RseB
MLGVAAGARASDAVTFLNNAAQAALRSNYMGTVVYQRGAHMETFRVTHMFDNGFEQERVLTLDGVPREVLRTGDQSTTYFPESKTVRIQPMTDRAFPALENAHIQALLNYYTASDLGNDRIAGLNARGMAFQPRDQLRHAQHLWAEETTGLLIRQRIINEKGETIEQASFTDMHSGQRISRQHFRSAFAGKSQDWRVEAVAGSMPLVNNTGWSVRDLPPGFAKVREGMRQWGSGGQAVPHLLFSDGYASISVFIEPGNSSESLGVVQQGGVNVYRRQWQEHVITVIGQTPAPALMAISNALVRNK